jgi:glutamate-1-semialdehyde aminotransferase
MNYKNRAEKSVGQGTTTNSKHWNSHVKGVYPTHIKGSTGPYLIDCNNKKYLDFICGLGTNLLGYGHPLVENAVSEYRHQGKSPSLPHILEVEVAEQLKQMFPWVERWKFLKTGSEACSAAVRMARAFNKKVFVTSEGYHGWHDMFTSLTPPAKGVDGMHAIMKEEFSDMHHASHSSSIIEPVQLDHSLFRIKRLHEMREHCNKNNIALIHDEIITGFRYLSHSVSKHHDVLPDLVVIGKAIANGYPLAAVGGSAEILDNDYFVSSTFAGEVSSLAACKAVMDIIRTKPEYKVDNLWNEGSRFLEEFNDYSMALDFQIFGYPTRGVFTGNEENIALFFQECCKAGILFGKSFFLSFAHIPTLSNTLKSCKDILIKMQNRKPKLIGELPQSPFSMRART